LRDTGEMVFILFLVMSSLNQTCLLTMKQSAITASVRTVITVVCYLVIDQPHFLYRITRVVRNRKSAALAT